MNRYFVDEYRVNSAPEGNPETSNIRVSLSASVALTIKERHLPALMALLLILDKTGGRLTSLTIMVMVSDELNFPLSVAMMVTV